MSQKDKQKGGRKLHWAWNYYDRKYDAGKNIATATCNECQESFSGHVDRMIKHISQCKKTSSAVKKVVAARHKHDQEIPTKKARIDESAQGSEQLASEPEFKVLSQEDIVQANMELAEAFSISGVPHAFSENKAFVRFCKILNPTYKPPNRKSMSSRWIPEKYAEVAQVVEGCIEKSPYVALSSDGWQDVQKRANINFIVHTPASLLHKCIDTGPRAQTGEYISELIINEVEEIGPQKVISLTCDHATNMKAAFRIVQARFPWIICIGCKAHCLHLVCTDIANLGEIAPLLDICKETVKFFCRKTPRSLLPEAQLYYHNRKAQLVLPSNVRWGTLHAMVESILMSVEPIKQVLRDSRVCDNGALRTDAKEQLNFYEAGENVQKLKEIELLLRPVSLTIKRIEGDELDATRAYFEAVQAMDEVTAQANLLQYLDEGVKDEIKKIVESRKNFAHSPIFQLVRMLDPSDRGRSFSNGQKVEANQVLVQLLKHPELSPHQNQIMNEWANWKSETGIFADPQRIYVWELLETEKLEPYTFWNGFFDDAKLSKIVTMLRPIAVTSAANERYWSIRGYNHSHRRSSLSSETASMEAYISYNLKQITHPNARKLPLPNLEPSTSNANPPILKEIEEEPVPDYEFMPYEDDEFVDDSQLFE